MTLFYAKHFSEGAAAWAEIIESRPRHFEVREHVHEVLPNSYY